MFLFHQRQHRQDTLLFHPSSTLVFQLLPPNLWRSEQHPLPYSLRHRPGPLLPTDARRRPKTQVPKTGTHPLAILSCPPRTTDEDERLGSQLEYIHE
jgi:hypothetical protein